MYVSDGYGNRRVVILDAATGKYLVHFGAYGNNPIDDKAAAAAGIWMNDFTKGNLKPVFFRTPVHCVKISKEGLIYVCDRGNNRVQVFNGRDPNLGKECSNPSGEAGKCGFVKEQFVAVKTNGLPGSAVSMNFSTDPRQTCLYVGDNSNMTIYMLKRDTLEELGRLGRSGREAGEFHWLHQVSIDSHGNIYSAEVDTGKRIQKFIRFGVEGCSGTGRTTVGGVLP
jgi:DNA-binding beta-propeller fold protein YncE